MNFLRRKTSFHILSLFYCRFPNELQRPRTMLKANSHIVKVKKKKSSVKSDFPHHWLFHSPIIHFWNTFLSQAQCGHPSIPRKNLLLCIMRDIRIWPFHCRWNICIKFLQVFIIAIFSNICNCAHFSLDWLSFHRWQL